MLDALIVEELDVGSCYLTSITRRTGKSLGVGALDGGQDRAGDIGDC